MCFVCCALFLFCSCAVIPHACVRECLFLVMFLLCLLCRGVCGVVLAQLARVASLEGESAPSTRCLVLCFFYQATYMLYGSDLEFCSDASLVLLVV